MAVVIAILLVSTEARAQGGGDVVVLITELMGAGVGEADPGAHFWWSGTTEPSWTESDQLLFEALRKEGVAPLVPATVNISRIYRRPLLPLVNAAQLGALLGGQRVLVGKVEYRALDPVPPLGVEGIEVIADVELVAAGSTEGISLQRLTVSRTVYGEPGAELLVAARSLGVGALAEVMGRSLKRRGGEVGAASEHLLVTFRNVGSAANLEALRRRLLEVEEVERVGERWASEGLIALEINPGGPGGADLIEYAIRVLEHHPFEEFRLQRHPRPTVEGTVEFWLEPRRSSF